MDVALDFLARHGVVVLLVVVFVDQMGVPIPAEPLLLAAGALSATSKINLIVTIGAATLGLVVADLIWFYLGRLSGKRVLGFLCRISIEPDSCVRQTQDVFSR